jgi:hypothetical protein
LKNPAICGIAGSFLPLEKRIEIEDAEVAFAAGLVL